MTASGKKPNVLFFFADDQRFDTINALGNDHISTPNMDKLVQRGTSFTHAHIPCGTSGAVCMPSRAMLNTGRTLFHIEGAGQSIPNNHTTIGEAFQNAGYETYGIGKWHNGTESYARSFTDGAEIFFGGMNDHWNVPACDFSPDGNYENKLCPFSISPGTTNELRHSYCDHISPGKHSSELFADAAINLLKNHQQDKPFYLYVSFMAPHDPRTMPKKYLQMYDPEKIILPDNFMGGHPFDNGDLHIRDEELAAFPRTNVEIRKHIAEYYAMISHLDAEIGRVMDVLEELGMTDDTIIMLAGDNGLAVGQHGLMGKQNCYEHSVRVPLLFAGPGIPVDKRSEDFVYLLDIFPTLCDICEIDVPESVEGKSLRPAMTGETGENKTRDTLYFAYTNYQRAVKKDQYKLIEYCVEDLRNTQLFNLLEDPSELNNLADDPDHAKLLKDMRSELFKLRDEWDDEKSEWGKVFWGNYRKSVG